MRRRRFLSLAGGGALAVTGAVAADNALLGYGVVTGTNLLEQDLESLANRRLGPVDGRTIDVGGTDVTLRRAGAVVGDDELPWDASRREIERFEDERGMADGALAQLVADVPALWNDDHAVEPVTVETFFERADAGEPRPHTVTALRGPRVGSVSPGVVERFAGVDPTSPRELANGLVDGFQEYGFYDAPRYVAGAIEDNVFQRRVDLRGPFASPTGFRALLDGENRGLFCYDFAYRSMEAFHAVPAADQDVPVVAAYVRDARHKHAYTGLATVLDGDGDGDRDDGDPTLLLTFLDYTPTTAAHDFGVAGVLGDDPAAYDDGHRTTGIYWNRRTDG